MKKSDYMKARRLIRDNGRFALKWLTPGVRDAMIRLLRIKDQADELRERQDMALYSRRVGLSCNARHTASIDVLRRFYDRKNLQK